MSRFLMCAAVLFLGAATLMAQGERGTITGTVTDSTGGSMAGAKVTVRNTATNISATVESNTAGIFTFPALNPGRYDLNVEASGFKSKRVSDIPLSIGLTATINLQLEVGQVTESVEVSATAVQLEAVTSGLGKTVESRRVVELPLLGRNPLQLAALAPGVVPTRGQVGAGGDAIGQAGNARISGGLANQNAILMDGGDSRGFTSGGQSYTFPLESVAEFKVETATYSAEFGRAGGGVVNVASKSGGNDFHGVLYEFLRNDHLNANAWSNNRNRVPRTLFQRNEYGAAVGGRVKRDKTFFYTNYEAVRQGSPRNFLATVPQPGWRTGDFRNTFDREGNQVQIFDPTTTRNVNGVLVRDQFPNNVIPSSRINPISNNISKFWAESNRPGEGRALVNNYFKTGKNVQNVDIWFARLDHQINDKHRIFGRFAGSQNENFAANLIDPAFPATSISSNPARNAGISLTSTFRPNLLGEFRISYTRLQNNSAPVSEGFDLRSLGFSGSWVDSVTYKQFPQILLQQYATGTGLAVATFGADEVTGLGGAGKNYLPQDTYHGQYHITWVKNRHKIKAGIDLQRLKMAAFNSRNSAGQFVFDRTFTQGPNPAAATSFGGNAFASFLLGAPVAGSLETTPWMALFQRYNAGYIQDDWRVTNRLTLNLGFRYEYTSPYGEKFGQIGWFDVNAVDPVTGRNGLFKWTPAGGYHNDPTYKTFGPRIGIAYQLDSKTVIRTAGGIFNAANNGLNAAASDFGSGLFTTNQVFLGTPQFGFTPPTGGSWSNPFAAGLVLPEKGVTTFVGQSVRVAFPDHPLAYVANWNFSIQRMLNSNTLVEVGYVGSKTTHLFWNRMDNALDPLLLSQWGSRIDDVVDNPFFGKINAGLLSQPRVVRKNLLRPFPQYQQILAVRRPYGDAHYQSMIARMEKAYSNGYTLSASYTMSKIIASTAESNTWVIGPSNALYNHNYNRGIDANDTPHRLVISHLWDLPFGYGKPHLSKGVAARVLGNWQFSGITVLQAGRPILISAPDRTSLLDFNYTNGRADRLKSGVIDNPTKTRWFDTSAFRTAAAYTVPTDSLSQPDLRTPWRNAFNWSVFKNNPITWKDRNINIQFRTEMYNVFNNPQFDVRGAATDVTNPLFGQVIEGGGERNIQLGIRVTF